MKLINPLPENKLYKRVFNIIKRYAKDYDYSYQSLFNDISRGCSSGMISELIYYSDTVKWYKKYKYEIASLLYETLDNTGLSIKELFGKNYDFEDPLFLDKYNQNLLAWFSFEEVSFQIAIYNNIEI